MLGKIEIQKRESKPSISGVTQQNSDYQVIACEMLDCEIFLEKYTKYFLKYFNLKPCLMVRALLPETWVRFPGAIFISQQVIRTHSYNPTYFSLSQTKLVQVTVKTSLGNTKISQAKCVLAASLTKSATLVT